MKKTLIFVSCFAAVFAFSQASFAQMPRYSSCTDPAQAVLVPLNYPGLTINPRSAIRVARLDARIASKEARLASPESRFFSRPQDIRFAAQDFALQSTDGTIGGFEGVGPGYYGPATQSGPARIVTQKTGSTMGNVVNFLSLSVQRPPRAYNPPPQ